VLGLAGATLAPTSLGLLSTLFADRRERRFAVVVWQMCFMGGALVGPVLGGLLLIGGWWGAVFLLGVPAMTLLVATAPFTVPESRDAAAGRVDLASVALSLAAVLPIVHGAKLLADGGGSALAIALIVGGLVVGLVFVRRQLRLADPLLDVRMFRRPAFAAIVGIMVLVTTISALLFVVAQYLQLVAGLTAVEAALAMAPASVTAIVAIGLAPRAARRWGSMPVIVAGMAIAAAGALTLGLSAAAPGVAAGLAVATFGNTSVVALGTVLVLEAFPDRRSATAGAIAETGTELGFALGIAGLGSLVTAVYRGAVVLPPGTAAAMAEAARDSLGGAVATGDPAIVRAAVVAYTAALPAIGVVVAGVAATIAVLALIFVRSPAKPLTSSESTANLD
jgi:DHA2 family multidrug resistance protein-like MFS transporter